MRPPWTSLIEQYRGFVRMKASAYFLAGGESEDLIQEGLIGFFKAVRDYRVDREASFRSFAELCVTRQIITAIKTAARNKHDAAQHLRLVQPHRARAPAATRRCPSPRCSRATPWWTRSRQVISSEELRSLVECLGDTLSDLESGVLTMYLEGRSYEEIADRLDCTPKTVDNALQRVKRKVLDPPARPRGARPALNALSGAARRSGASYTCAAGAAIDALGHLELPPRQQPLILRGAVAPGASAR